MSPQQFQKVIWAHYREHKRDFPWRRTCDPYKILVSEIMLQQTQALRVVPKYKSFLKKFPTVNVLASASLKEVLKEWQGLGYNRRAIYLKRAAEMIQSEFRGKFPKDFNTLCSLPGIGPATAGDLMAFAWNIPVVVIETNIRSVFIHFFFSDEGKAKSVQKKVSDKEVLPLIEKTLDRKNPREWYSALFDYGAYLKETSNPSRKSAHYVRQTSFTGSYREKRAAVLRTLIEKPRASKEVQEILNYGSKITEKILLDLSKDGFIKEVPSVRLVAKAGGGYKKYQIA